MIYDYSYLFNKESYNLCNCAIINFIEFDCNII